jgi:hypothetical protein
MAHDFSRSRRGALKKSAFGMAAIAVSAFMPWARLQAKELPRVSEDDETAKALHYVHDANKSAKRPSDDQWCRNCRYFKGEKTSDWDRCDLFPGKVVSAQGWCNVWAAK